MAPAFNMKYSNKIFAEWKRFNNCFWHPVQYMRTYNKEQLGEKKVKIWSI